MNKSFIPFAIVLLLVVLATPACGSTPSDEQIWEIKVWAEGGDSSSEAAIYYCESYNINTAGTLTISGCSAGNYSKTFLASQKWEINLR